MMQSGQVLRLLASDAMAVVDVPHFCSEAGHGFEGMTELSGTRAYLIRKG